MNKKAKAVLVSVFAVTLYTGCSNATYGFDEDSPFYTEPAANNEVEKADETPLITEEKADKTDAKPKSGAKKEDPDEENETTFSYDPNSMPE